MRLTVKEKQKAARITASRYQRASKKKKGAILDEFVALTGYDRCYASYLLKNHGRKVWINSKVVTIGDIRKRHKRRRQRTYGEDVLKPLKQIWVIMDCICGKRLRPILKELLAILHKHKELRVTRETKKKLLRISAATIDRILKPERKKYELKGRSLTKPGTLLKHQIPIRTFSEWNEQRPGFVEIDLVGHEGGNPRGDFIQTLNVTDVCTGWTEMQAVKNKAQIWVFEALKDIRIRLPFELRYQGLQLFSERFNIRHQTDYITASSLCSWSWSWLLKFHQMPPPECGTEHLTQGLKTAILKTSNRCLGGILLFNIFEWDEDNIEHILRHNVIPDEVEEACVNEPYVRKGSDKRYLVYGISDSGRYIFIVGINKGKGIFRTITARDMTEREKSLYRRRRRNG